jgi:hypothetical protein
MEYMYRTACCLNNSTCFVRYLIYSSLLRLFSDRDVIGLVIREMPEAPFISVIVNSDWLVGH